MPVQENDAESGGGRPERPGLFATRAARAARVLVDRRALKRGGAHALFIDGLSIRTETVTHARRNSPWTRADTHAKTRTRHGLTK